MAPRRADGSSPSCDDDSVRPPRVATHAARRSRSSGDGCRASDVTMIGASPRAPSPLTATRYTPGRSGTVNSPSSSPGVPLGHSLTGAGVSPAMDRSDAVTRTRDDREISLIDIRTDVRPPGREAGPATRTSIGDGDSLAASAIVVCQNRSNDEKAGSRYRHESSAPLTLSRPDPTGKRQRAARPLSESTRAPEVSATIEAPMGRRRGNANSVARSPAVSPLA